ncbi:hypothetical protein ABMA28_016543 [Loxostege sticticalis]|uniref:Reverse transcriptase domain-containing protein n=1 Tax=Loxostege sticticalis TaxID=481309 RepID=A0ABD0T998_LOXSC
MLIDSLVFVQISHITGLGLDNLSVGHFNAGSLGTKHEEFIAAAEELAPDILAVNETWLRTGEEDRAPKLAGYRLKHLPRPDHVKRGRGGGVGFYIRRGLNFKICPHPNPTSSIEQMWLSLQVHNQNVVVGTAYNPPWQDVDLFLDSITESVAAFAWADGLILTGDFNIDLLRTGSGKAKAFSQFTHSSNLNQIITEPTHYTDDGSTLIDVVCTDMRVLRVTVEHKPDLSRHCMLLTEFKIKKEKPVPRWVIYRPLKNILPEQLNLDLNAIKWENYECIHNVNQLVRALTASIRGLMDLHAPLKRQRFKHLPHPWLTDTIRTMMRTRDSYHKRYKVDNTVALQDSYRQMKRAVQAAIEREKRCYFNNNLNSQLNNPKKLWKNLKGTVVPDKRKPSDLPQSLSDPDAMNTHFLDVPGANNITISQLTYYEFHKHYGASGFRLHTVSSELVHKTLLSLKSNAEGCDGLSLDMLKLTLPYSLDAITTIINRSIVDSVFPEDWKVAVVKPLPKTSHPESVGELRPISILPCLSKVLERIVCDQLTGYLEANNILPDLQSGFRRGHGTATALADVVDNLLTAQDQGRVSMLLLLDFSRAFDCINIPLLLAKMSFYGFEESTIEWFRSYLSDRRQFVEVRQTDGTKLQSRTQAVTRGVPQGSILGPILFILYGADIVKKIEHCSYHLYADDLQLYLSFKPNDQDTATTMVNNDLQSIADWCSSNCLVLNPRKSKLILIGTPNNVSKINNISDGGTQKVALGGHAVRYHRHWKAKIFI